MPHRTFSADGAIHERPGVTPPIPVFSIICRLLLSCQKDIAFIWNLLYNISILTERSRKNAR